MVVIKIPGFGSPEPIPSAVRSRSTLYFHHLNVNDDGSCCLIIPAEAYPEIFSIRLPDIFSKTPLLWRQKEDSPAKYLWFPPQALSEEDKATITNWCRRWEEYVLLGKGKPIAPSFGDELDFCMALSMTRESPTTQVRYKYGEAEYQLKYGDGDPRHLQTLLDGLEVAFSDLPLPSTSGTVLLTTVPSRSDNDVPGKLISGLAERTGCQIVQANLNFDKQQLKGLPFDQKIPEWRKVYGTAGAVTLTGDISEKTVLIIDDLYQSGATMWCYAGFLKQQGASHVIGLAAVKSLRDSDNQ